MYMFLHLDFTKLILTGLFLYYGEMNRGALAGVIVLLLLVFTSLIWPISINVAEADVSTSYSHTDGTVDSCDNCHYVDGSIRFDSNLLYSQCVANCHDVQASALSSSRHSSIGCRCHSILHIGHGEQDCGSETCHGSGYENGPNAPYSIEGNFMHVFYLDKIGFKRYGIHDIGDNYFPYSDLDLTIKFGLDYTTENKTYVAYIDPYGESVGTSVVRYLTCYNCHFVRTDFSQAASFETDPSDKYIPIPEEAMWIIGDAHSIGTFSEFNLEGEDIGVGEGSYDIQFSYILLISSVVILAVILFLFKR